jgi:hypothetical protein
MHALGRITRCGIFAALVACAARPAVGLVVVPPATNDNTSAPTPEVLPANNPAWLNVGDNGVYIGQRWVLTVVHAGAAPTTFPGASATPFAVEPGSTIMLTNPSGMGLTNHTDLMLYRLAADPGLPPITFASEAPEPGDEVILVGDGRAVTPSATETHWDVTGPPENYVWTETPAGDDFHGYKSTLERKLWGTNVIESDEPLENLGDSDVTLPVDAGFGDVISFYTDFDNPGVMGSGATAAEAQGMFHDSGSAMFSKENGAWVLSGMTHAVSLYSNQPGGTFTAIYGNLTFAADLSVYGDQIMAIIVPELGGFLLVGGVGLLAGAYRWSTRWPRRVHTNEQRRFGS